MAPITNSSLINNRPNDSAKASSSCLLQQNQQSRTQECTDPPEKREADACDDHVDQSHNRSHGDDKEDQQDPPTDNVDQNQDGGASLKTAHSDEAHRTAALIVRNCFLLYPLLILLFHVYVHQV